MEAAALSFLLAHQAGVLNPLVDAIIPVRKLLFDKPILIDRVNISGFCRARESSWKFRRYTGFRPLFSFLFFILFLGAGNQKEE